MTNKLLYQFRSMSHGMREHQIAHLAFDCSDFIPQAALMLMAYAFRGRKVRHTAHDIFLMHLAPGTPGLTTFHTESRQCKSARGSDAKLTRNTIVTRE